MDSADREWVSRKLPRFLSKLLETPPRFTLARDGCVDSLVTVAVKVNLCRFAGALRGELKWSGCAPLSETCLCWLREAIDFLYLILALEPAMLWSNPGIGVSPVNIADTNAWETLARGGAFRLQVTVDVAGFETTRLLVPRLCQYFVGQIEVSTFVKFRSVRKRLSQKLSIAKPTWRTDGQAVALHLVIHKPDTSDDYPDGPEEQLRDIVTMIEYAEAMDRFETHEEHLLVPVVVERVGFHADLRIITQNMLQVIERLHLLQKKGFAVCEAVTLEPNDYVDYSPGDVTAFLDTVVTADHDNIKVCTADDRSPYRMDDDGRDCSEVCDAILCGVAASKKIPLVSLGGMAKRCASPASRRGIYRAMIERLLTHPQPCDLEIAWIDFQPSDAQILREEYDTWRRANPNGRLRVRKLDLHVKEQDTAFALAMICILDDVEELSLLNGYRPQVFFPEEMVQTLLRKFTSLCKLYIKSADIASMCIFLEPRAVPLKELGLLDFRLSERDSFAVFVRAIGDPTTYIAQTLRALSIGVDMEKMRQWTSPYPTGEGGGTSSNDMTISELNDNDADEFANSLYTNNTLDSFEANFWPSARAQTLSNRLNETHGRVVPGRLTGQSLCSEIARRVAFLSVAQGYYEGSRARMWTIPSVVKQIFDFAAPTTMREVRVWLPSDDDEDDNNSDSDYYPRSGYHLDRYHADDDDEEDYYFGRNRYDDEY